MYSAKSSIMHEDMTNTFRHERPQIIYLLRTPSKEDTLQQNKANQEKERQEIQETEALRGEKKEQKSQEKQFYCSVQNTRMEGFGGASL